MTNKTPKDKWVRIVGVPFIAFMIILLSRDNWLVLPLSAQVLKILKNLFYVFIYFECNRIIFIYLRNKYPDLKDTAKKIGIQVIVFIVFIITAAFIMTIIDRFLPYDDNESFWEDYKEIAQKSAVLLIIITISYECAYFFGKWEHSLFESERLKKEALISQFELLKNQISPHFLFNSLNALITIVPEDPELSVVFIQKLSNVYRHVLNYTGKDLISLEVELRFLRDYLFLFQMRFGENLVVEYLLPESLEKISVVPFALQMLVENAIKHNVISNKKPLKIMVVINERSIKIKNNLQPKTSGVESTNTGLKNIASRYQILTDRTVDIVVTADEFSVALPLIFDK